MARILDFRILVASLVLVAVTAASVAAREGTSGGAAGDDVANDPMQGTAARNSVEENPLLVEWTGPYGGVPPFDRVRVEDFEPALEAAMREQLEEIDRIAANPEAPTFENTI